MKTGILTFHDCINYGALLQAYALWKTAGRLTGAAEVIDYKNPRITTRMQIERDLKDRSVKGIAKRMLTVPFRQRKNALFEEFAKKQGMLSAQSYDRQTVEQCDGEYDAILFGSDQIWNLTLTGGDENYYGAFAKKSRKIAYAASVGGYDLESDLARTGGMLRGFSALSTRENRDRALIEDKCGLKVRQVLDPTFLLKKEEWLALQEKIDVPQKYILLYLISPVKEDFAYAKALGRRTGLPVLYINYSYRREAGVKNLRAVAPGQFLYLLNHAQYVVTNSFHGTALSINLEKDFYCQMPARKEKSNVRAGEILSRCGLEKRIVRDGDVIVPEAVENWDVVRSRLDEARASSLAHLREALEIQS